jgi:hypothetical protein
VSLRCRHWRAGTSPDLPCGSPQTSPRKPSQVPAVGTVPMMRQGIRTPRIALSAPIPFNEEACWRRDRSVRANRNEPATRAGTWGSPVPTLALPVRAWVDASPMRACGTLGRERLSQSRRACRRSCGGGVPGWRDRKTSGSSQQSSEGFEHETAVLPNLHVNFVYTNLRKEMQASPPEVLP